MKKIKVGVSKIDITPSSSVPLGGYLERTSLSIGVHDPLYVRSLAIDDGEKTVAIISLDLLAVDRKMVEEVREDIEETTGIDKENVMVAATHTHAGPDGIFRDTIFPSRSDPNEKLISTLKTKINQSILNAVEKMRTAEVRIGKVIVEGASANRRVKNGPVDKQLISIRFDNNDGKLISAIINFACHPTVLDASNLLISADYPGYAMSLIEKAKSNSVPLFLNSAAGDISTRYVRRESSFSEAERIGNIVGAYALVAIEKSEKIEIDEIKVNKKDMELHVRRFPSDEKINSMISQVKATYMALKKRKSSPADLRRVTVIYEALKGLKEYLNRLRPLERKTVKIEIQIITFGDNIAIVGVPGELFAEIGMKIKENSPFETTIIAGYANGYIGYIPTPETYESLSYESAIAIIDKDSSQKLYNSIIDFLRNI